MILLTLIPIMVLAEFVVWYFRHNEVELVQLMIEMFSAGFAIGIITFYILGGGV